VRTTRETLREIAAGDPLPHLADPRPEIRRVAVSACASLGPAALEPLSSLLDNDQDEAVRAEVIEVLGKLGPDAYTAVWSARDDASHRVVEAVATALGEIGDSAAIPWLLSSVGGHEDGLVREAAVAALGSIGDEAALEALLDAARTGKPQIRRRAVVALTAFEGPEVEAALLAARLDRNPMVREVGEGILGRPATDS
jgi:HEAT repeat protein